jgi:hypothetical protein
MTGSSHRPTLARTKSTRTSASLVVVMVRVAVVVAMAVVVRTLTGPLGGLSTARLPQVPAAA